MRQAMCNWQSLIKTKTPTALSTLLIKQTRRTLRKQKEKNLECQVDAHFPRHRYRPTSLRICSPGSVFSNKRIQCCRAAGREDRCLFLSKTKHADSRNSSRDTLVSDAYRELFESDDCQVEIVTGNQSIPIRHDQILCVTSHLMVCCRAIKSSLMTIKIIVYGSKKRDSLEIYDSLRQAFRRDPNWIQLTHKNQRHSLQLTLTREPCKNPMIYKRCLCDQGSSPSTWIQQRPSGV